MKENLHIHATFKSIHVKERKKLVTMKVEKLINMQLKKTAETA